MSNEKEEGEIEGVINVQPLNTKYSRGSSGHSGGNEVFFEINFPKHIKARAAHFNMI